MYSFLAYEATDANVVIQLGPNGNFGCHSEKLKAHGARVN